MRNFILGTVLTICIYFPVLIYGQLGAIYYNGAFSAGLQGMSNHQGAEAIFTNPAGLVNSVNRYGATFNYTDQYGLGEISRISLGGRLKTNSGHFALGLYQYGVAEYKEQSLALSYARSFFENFQVGIQFNHNRLSIQTFNSVSQNAINIGLQSNVNKSVMVSAVIANVFKTQSDLYSSPQHIQFGITYKPSSTVSILVEAIKQSERPMSGVVVLNYLPSQKINLRLGTDITKGEVGISAFYNITKMKMGFGYATHQHLGGSYTLSGLID